MNESDWGTRLQNENADFTNKLFLSIKPSVTHKLNINKVKTLEDVIKIIGALNIEITLREGTTSEMYEELKAYFD